MVKNGSAMAIPSHELGVGIIFNFVESDHPRADRKEDRFIVVERHHCTDQDTPLVSCVAVDRDGNRLPEAEEFVSSHHLTHILAD